MKDMPLVQYKKCEKFDCYRKTPLEKMYCCMPCNRADQYERENYEHSAICTARTKERGEWNNG